MAESSTQPSSAGLDEGQWSDVCKALRALLKDHLHFSQEGAKGEGDAFEKLARVKLEITGDQTRQARVIIRCDEFAVADGLVLVYPSEVTEIPPDDATYYEMWTWAQSQSDLTFIPFDVKVMSLKHGQVSHGPSSYYQWTRPKFTSEKQAEYVEFVIAMIEGIDTHVAVLPAKAWKVAREQWLDSDNPIYDVPPWIALGMVADSQLDVAIASIIGSVSGGQTWYKNPSNQTTFVGWRPKSISDPSANTRELVGHWGSSIRAVQGLWREVRQAGGQIHPAPFAPWLVDFVLWLPDVGYIWVEHKTRQASLNDRNFLHRQELRGDPFQPRRVWHFLYYQGLDGVLCIPRNKLEPAWEELGWLPEDGELDSYYCAGFEDAYERIIKPHSDAARAAVARTIASLPPGAITDGLLTEASSARLRAAGAHSPSNSHESQPLTRPRIVPSIGSTLNSWCRHAGQGVCLGLGGGNPYGTHVMIDYAWSKEDKQAFDKHGELPLCWFSPDIAKHKYTPLWTGDYSMVSNLKKGVWFPFALRKENWKMPVSTPRGLIIGSLTETFAANKPAEPPSWVLLLPTGLTAKYKQGNFLQPIPESARALGSHLFRRVTLADSLVPDPKWPTKRSAVCMNHDFLLHKDINLGRYVLNLPNGTVYREILKILRDDGMVSIVNPMLRKTRSQTFDAKEYQGIVGDLLQGIWDYGYGYQDAGQKGRNT